MIKRHEVRETEWVILQHGFPLAMASWLVYVWRREGWTYGVLKHGLVFPAPTGRSVSLHNSQMNTQDRALVHLNPDSLFCTILHFTKVIYSVARYLRPKPLKLVTLHQMMKSDRHLVSSEYFQPQPFETYVSK